MRAAALSDTGRAKPNNEDRVLADPGSGLLVVTDGMGGHAGGEVASALAIDVIAGRFEHAVTGPEQPGARGARAASLVAAIEDADRAIRARMAAEPGLEGMGTTVVAAAAGETDVHVAHVGDSRAYLLHGGVLRQLTRDHSLVADMVTAGEISPRQARTHRLRHVLSRCLGQSLGPLVVEVQTVEWSAGDLLMLCSDGLPSMLEDKRIRSLLVRAGADLEQACRTLVDAANRAGGGDNISVVVACPG